MAVLVGADTKQGGGTGWVKRDTGEGFGWARCVGDTVGVRTPQTSHKFVSSLEEIDCLDRFADV